MKIVLLSLLFIPLFAAGQIDTLVRSDLPRTYKVQLPNDYGEQKQYPLLFVLHGYHYENQGMPEYSGFDKFVDRDCIVVYPHGLKEENGTNYFWNSGGGLAKNYGGVDDVQFIEDLIDTLPNRYAIDRNRIFIVGHSNGGMMCYRLAMELSDKITAMANLAGSMMFDTIRPEVPVPILHIHGTADPAVPLAGSTHSEWPFLPTDEVLSRWAEWNRCNPVADTLANTPSYLYLQWSDAEDKHNVIGCFIKGQGHDWAEITKSGWNLAEHIWSFFTTGELSGAND